MNDTNQDRLSHRIKDTSSESSQHRQKAGNGHRSKRWLIRAILFDVILAAFALYFFSMYYFLLPRDLSQNAKILPGALNTDRISQSIAAEQSINNEELYTAPANEMDWREKFAGQFTNGTVEQTEKSYKSNHISVSINKVQDDGVTYFVADIYIASLEFFKTAFAKDKFGSGIHDSTFDIAKQKGAVLAINGDYSGTNAGPVVRNGVLYRDEIYQDALVLYFDGSMRTFTAQSFDMEEIKNEGAYQVWTFGPMLLKNGKPMDEFNSTLNPANPRTAVGYYEPGHYCFVVVDGRQPGYSSGYTLKQMSQLFYDLGCKVAFNLDGGQSSEMVFQDSFVNRPYKGGRGTSDILYIADE